MVRNSRGTDIANPLFWAVAALVFAAGCGVADTISPSTDNQDGDNGGTELPSYRDRALQGTVGGEQWRYSHAILSESVGGDVYVAIYGGDEVPDQPCSDDAHDNYEGWSLNVRLPAVREERWGLEPRERVLAFSKTTVDAAQQTTTKGWVELVTTRTKTVSGKLVARASSEYVVNGEFLGEQCESDRPVAGP